MKYKVTLNNRIYEVVVEEVSPFREACSSKKGNLTPFFPKLERKANIYHIWTVKSILFAIILTRFLQEQ